MRSASAPLIAPAPIRKISERFAIPTPMRDRYEVPSRAVQEVP